jgi:hypothetical protein
MRISMFEQLINLCQSLGDRGRVNTDQGRWIRLTRYQVEVVAGCLLYVGLCAAYILIRLGVVSVMAILRLFW